MEIFENSDLENEARNIFLTDVDNYNIRFKFLLLEVYKSYEQMISDKQVVYKNENKITAILVDEYLEKEIEGYIFEREKDNNLGRVDIYIVEDFSDNKPEFVIECKLLDNKNLIGVTGKNSEYVKNGIYRFLSEHYFSYNDFYTNAMIGFVIEELDIIQNIDNINLVSKNIIGELVHITQKIILEEENLYKSTYRTIKDKSFILYHLMMDFSSIKGVA